MSKSLISFVYFSETFHQIWYYFIKFVILSSFFVNRIYILPHRFFINSIGRFAITDHVATNLWRNLIWEQVNLFTVLQNFFFFFFLSDFLFIVIVVRFIVVQLLRQVHSGSDNISLCTCPQTYHLFARLSLRCYYRSLEEALLPFRDLSDRIVN